MCPSFQPGFALAASSLRDEALIMRRLIRPGTGRRELRPHRVMRCQPRSKMLLA